MATKTRRIEMREDPDSEGRIMQAASLLGQSVSKFVLSAASSAADAVLARADTTLMPAEQFDSLMRSLDEADEASSLRAAARASRRALLAPTDGPSPQPGCPGLLLDRADSGHQG